MLRASILLLAHIVDAVMINAAASTVRAHNCVWDESRGAIDAQASTFQATCVT